MRDDPTVVALVERARAGDHEAWQAIVARYAPLVWSVCVRHRLSGADADDVGATVWLRLVERLGELREPAALAGWLATTARNECLSLLRGKKRHIPAEVDGEWLDPPSDEWLLTQERHVLLRQAFAALSERCRRLLSMLFDDPPTPYTEIAGALGMTVGSIGPNRMRCLQRLRDSPGMVALKEGEPGDR